MFGFFGGLMLLVVELARVRFERSRVMQNLTSYLPSDTARKVAFELPSSSIQAERCNVTLLSADLRNFSALGERRPPEESASVLHYFFTKVNTIVEQYGGRVHEYKGDNVLVVWDGDGTEPATKALAAAIEIEREVNANLLPEVGIEGLEPLAVGIGIEQGPALMGSIGPAHRRAHTLCGETVSVTLRIQEMTADLSSPILIGEVAARYMSDANLESLGHYLLPGLITAHILFAPANQAPTNKVSSTRDGLTLLKGGLG
jgi:class 3 adenylate cyclase